MEELRNKWCDDLEDILQCPICFYCRVDVKIYQCVEGHHVCHICKPKWNVCPTCGKGWTPYINRVVQDLGSKFAEIKESLIDPLAEINKVKVPKTNCTATQTCHVVDDTETISAPAVPVSPPVFAAAKSLSDGHSGPYPCCVGDCTVKMGFEPLIDHIKKAHALHYVELSMKEDDLLFQHSWSFDYTEDLEIDRVFRITDVGIFILKVAADKCGDLSAYIMMLHCGPVSKQFHYQLKMSCGGDHSYPSFTGTVHSCRSPSTYFDGTKCLVVKNADILKNQPEQILKYTLLLSRKLYLDDQLSKATGLNKKRTRNRNRAAKPVKALS